jgi:hypothetical protein
VESGTAEPVVGSYQKHFVGITGTCRSCDDLYHQDPLDNTKCFQETCATTSYIAEGGFCQQCPDYTHRDAEDITRCLADECLAVVEKLMIDGTCELCPEYSAVDEDGTRCVENDCAPNFYSTAREGCLQCELFWRQDPDDSTACVQS